MLEPCGGYWFDTYVRKQWQFISQVEKYAMYAILKDLIKKNQGANADKMLAVVEK